MYESFSIIFVISVLLSFINYKWLKLPTTIGQLILSLAIAIIIIFAKPISPVVYNYFCDIVQNADFTHILLDVLLGFLLFAGALHVNINDLKKEKWAVLLFATFSVLISTFIIGVGLFFIAQLLSCYIPFIHCLLFGALISPTDPIAVISLLKSANVSKSLQLKIEGESLFNDGIGVIVFSGILLFTEVEEMMQTEEGQNIFLEIVELFVVEVGLGLIMGAILGYLGFRLMKASQKDKFISTMITLAIVFGGYALASILHTSGPLAMVVAGLYIGHAISKPDFDKTTRSNLDGFWHILDESLNGVLFVFLGLAIHLIKVESSTYLWLIPITIILVLAARFISILIPYSLLKHKEHSWLNTTYVMTWGGLKGGISLALAFSLKPELSQNTILLLTYSIVIFSILVQGLSIPKLIKKLM